MPPFEKLAKYLGQETVVKDPHSVFTLKVNSLRFQTKLVSSVYYRKDFANGHINSSKQLSILEKKTYLFHSAKRNAVMIIILGKV